MKTSGSLRQYRKKRNFLRTDEPWGALPETPGPTLHYVVQKHAARRLHYDFRLELDGTLKSWAVPKGPSLNPSDKRLAVHVEDHPMEYADFEGIIPPRQYGAGNVMVWDRGEWIPDGDPKAGYNKGHLKFMLAGQKLRGCWTLVRMGGARNRDGKNWLLIKGRDKNANTEMAVTSASLVNSVKSGRSMKQIAAARTAEWKPRRATPVASSNRRPLSRVARAVEGSQRRAKRKLVVVPCPDWVQPQLATLVEKAPEGKDWIHELKYDGYRMLCRIEDGASRLFSRNGHDWTDKLTEHAIAAGALTVNNAWLDGELVALTEDGTMSFQELQKAFDATGHSQLVYFAFDLLFLNGLDLRAMPLLEPKRQLAQLLAANNGALRYSDHVEGHGNAVFDTACRAGLEGLVAKRRDAQYVPGRNKNWVKVKCRRRQEFVIGGFTDPGGSRHGFGALLLGVFEHDQGRDRFLYVGRVGTGFSDTRLSHLRLLLHQVERLDSPFTHTPRGREAKGVHWVEPRLVAEIQFAEWTQDGLLRQASFLGLREDKPARSIVREIPSHPAKPISEHEPPRSASREADTTLNGSSSSTTVAGVRITHPDRVLYVDDGITKLELAHYYEMIAKWILPHIRGRPLTVVRCPEGHARGCFYQKHATNQVDEALDRVEVEEAKGPACYLIANTIQALMVLVQLGVLELHTWGAKQDRLDRPDRMTLDLDPAPGLPWEEVIEAAHLIKTLLDELNLKSFVKTTGGKGLHIVIPLQRRHGWDEVKEFSKALAGHMARTIPTRFTDTMSKRARKGKVYIDYLRNGQGATAVAAYSTRAKSGAPLSIPLAWHEVSPSLRSDQFTIRNVSARISNIDTDPWAEYDTVHQSLTVDMKRRIGMKPPPF